MSFTEAWRLLDGTWTTDEPAGRSGLLEDCDGWKVTCERCGTVAWEPNPAGAGLAGWLNDMAGWLNAGAAADGVIDDAGRPALGLDFCPACLDETMTLRAALGFIGLVPDGGASW